MMFVGRVLFLFIIDSTFCTISTVGNLRGGSFLFPPEPIGVKLLTALKVSSNQIGLGYVYQLSDIT